MNYEETLPTAEQSDAVGVVLLNRYRFIKKIGQGGMGMIRLFQDVRLNRLVVIKSLFSDDMAELQAEARMTARFKAAGLVTIHDIIVAQGAMHLVLEYVPGSTLKQVIKQNRLQRVAVMLMLQWCLDLTLGVHHMGVQGAIHADLKPENVIIDEQGNPKLLDFGIALDEVEAAREDKDSLCGTPPYMSPEQARMTTMRKSSDVYSLCVMFFELLTGINPNLEGCPATSSPLMVAAHVAEILDGKGPKDSRLLALLKKAGVSQGFAVIIVTGLQPQPADRYRDAGIMAEEFQAQMALVKKRKVQKALAARFGAVVLVLVTALTVWGYTQATGRARAESEAASIARKAETEAVGRLAAEQEAAEQAKRARDEAENARDAQAKLAAQSEEKVLVGQQLAKAREASRGSDYIAASEILQGVLKKWPDAHAARMDWADVLWVTSDRQRAVDQYEILANTQEVDPAMRDTARFWIAWISIQQELCSFEEVPDLIDRVNEPIRQSLLRAYLAFSWTNEYTKRNQPQLSLQKFKEAGAILDSLFVTDGVMQYEAVNVDKRDRWLVYFLLGYWYQRVDPELSMDFYARSLASSPSNTSALRLRGKMWLLRAEKLADGGEASLAARSDLLRLIKISPGMENAQLLHLRSLCSMAQGKKELGKKIRWLNRAHVILNEREKRQNAGESARKEIDWLMRTAVQVGFYQAYTQAGNSFEAQIAYKRALGYAGPLQLMNKRRQVTFSGHEQEVWDRLVPILGVEAIREAAKRVAKQNPR